MSAASVSTARIHVLSLWRPWPATFFQPIARPKRVENRGKPPPRNVVGTWIAFHAGQRFDHDRLPLILANAPEVSGDPKDHPIGLIGMAFIAGCSDRVVQLPEEQWCWWLGPFAYSVTKVVPFDAEFQQRLYVPDRKTGVLGPAPGQQGWKFLSDGHAAMIREKYGDQLSP